MIEPLSLAFVEDQRLSSNCGMILFLLCPLAQQREQVDFPGQIVNRQPAEFTRGILLQAEQMSYWVTPVRVRISAVSAVEYGVPSFRNTSWNHRSGSPEMGFSQECQG